MTRYIALRHGSNGANQPMTQTAVIGFIEAKNRKEAEKITRSKDTIYNNQTVEIILASKAPARLWNEAAEIEAFAGEIIPANQIGCVLCGKHPSKALRADEGADWHCGLEVGKNYPVCM